VRGEGLKQQYNNNDIFILVITHFTKKNEKKKSSNQTFLRIESQSNRPSLLFNKGDIESSFLFKTKLIAA